jgi:nitroreductase
MNAVVFVNGTIADADRAAISIFDHGFLYGEGIYETLRTYGRQPFLFDRHMRRMRHSAELMRLDVPFADAALLADVEKTMAAPVTAIVAYDERFFVNAGRLFPHFPQIADMFVNSSEVAKETAFRNGTLQGAYLILAARALGIDAGPMSGFDNAKVDAEFFGSGETKNWRSNFLVNLGHGDPAKLFPRGPRLSFEEACRLL